MANKQLRRWAFTIFRDDKDHDDILKVLKGNAKSYCFQQESCPSTGRVHYQGRVSWKQPIRARELSKLLWNSHISPEVNMEAGTFYCLKEETRLNGPWTDKDKKKLVQKHIQEMVLNPWQQELKDILTGDLDDGDTRTINCVIDERGNTGKTWFKKYCHQREGAIIVPSTCTTAEDMISCVANQTKVYNDMNKMWQGTIIIDMPRAMAPKHWWTIAQGIETIKDGSLYDKRYHYTEVLIEPPALCVMTNTRPPIQVFSSDRWRFFTVVDGGLEMITDIDLQASQ